MGLTGLGIAFKLFLVRKRGSQDVRYQQLLVRERERERERERGGGGRERGEEGVRYQQLLVRT